MKLSDIITTEPIKSMFGKRTGKYISFLNADRYFGAEGATAEESLNNLNKKLALMARYAMARRYCHSPSGKTVFCLYYGFHGWSYEIVKQGCHPCSCGFNESYTEDTAFAAMKRHADSYED